MTEGCGALLGLYRCGVSVRCRRVRRGRCLHCARRRVSEANRATRPGPPANQAVGCRIARAADATGRFVGRAISPAAAGDGLHGGPAPGRGRAVSPPKRGSPRRVPAAGVNARPTAGTVPLPGRQGLGPCKGQGVKGSNQSSRRLRRKTKQPAAAATTSRA